MSVYLRVLSCPSLLQKSCKTKNIAKKNLKRVTILHLESSPRGCLIITWTGILLHTSKTLAPRVKSQARRQNN